MKQLTAKDLSPDQRVAHDGITTWLNRGSHTKPTLTLAGFAGCLSGETGLMYRRGSRLGVRPITLRDLYLKFNGQIVPGVRGISNRWVDLTVPTYLLSLWPDSTAAYNRVIAVFESGKKAVLRLDFDDGKHLVLTHDHPIATPDGFVAAGDLAVGDTALGRGSLRPIDEGKGRRPLDLRPPRVIVNTKHHPGPIKTVMCNGIAYDYVRVARARLVVESAMNEIPYDEFVHALKKNKAASAGFKFLPANVDVHHLDEDTLNDDISNLEVLPHDEHARLHTSERNENVEYVREVRVVSAQVAGEEMTYDIQMEPPANNFVANGVFVHNTGKSSVVSVLAKELPEPAFCAFTGKASSVLGRKLGESGIATTPRAVKVDPDTGERPFEPRPYCGTIHGLVYRPCEVCMMEEDDPTHTYGSKCRSPEAGVIGMSSDPCPACDPPPPKRVKGGDCPRCKNARFFRREELDRDYGVIVVDEASMVTDDMLADLLVFGVPILAVGDHGQLPPVKGTGTLMKNPDLRLEKIHRQAEGNPIIALSKYIRERGDIDDSLEDGEAFTILPMRKMSRYLERRWTAANLAADPLGSLLISWTNKMRVNLNYDAREALGFKDEPPSKGEVLICLKNAPPIYNGMRGVLRDHPRKFSDPQAPKWSVNIDFLEDRQKAEGILISEHQFFAEKTIDYDQARELGVSMAKLGQLYDFGYALTCHKCVAPDTLVETPDGLVRAETLREGQIATPTGRAKYGAFVRNPAGAMLDVTTDDGYSLRVTPDHGVDVWSPDNGYERRLAKDIAPGDMLRLRLGAEFRTGRADPLPTERPQDVRAKRFRLPAVCNADVAEFLGCMVADGTVYGKGFRLAKRHEDVADKFDTLCRRLFGVKPSRFFKLGAHHVEVSSALIADWLRDVGGMTPNAKAIPACILTAPLGAQAAFLRGLFEDGTVNVHADGMLDHIEFTSIMPEVRRAVRTMLLRFGIVSGQTPSRPSLYIYGTYAKRFGMSIGFISGFKQGRLDLAREPEGTRYVLPLRHEERHLAPRGVIQRHRAIGQSFGDRIPFHHTTVNAVLPYSGESVCVEVPSGHQFLQDGFCGWNCQGSQADEVCVVEEPGLFRMGRDDKTRWMYTAATRAAKRLVWVR